MQTIRKGRTGAYYRNYPGHISPKGAYNILMRFLSNPCPSIAAMIIDQREDIAKIAREYSRLLKMSNIPEGYRDGIKMFQRAFEQVEIIMRQYGFEDLEHLDDETRKLLKVPRVDLC